MDASPYLFLFTAYDEYSKAIILIFSISQQDLPTFFGQYFEITI